MTGGNYYQRVMTTGGRFPLHARCTLSQPISYIVSHTRPIEPVTQPGLMCDSGPSCPRTMMHDRLETTALAPAWVPATVTATLGNSSSSISLHSRLPERLFRRCHTNRSSGHKLLTSAHEGKTSDRIHSNRRDASSILELKGGNTKSLPGLGQIIIKLSHPILARLQGDEITILRSHQQTQHQMADPPLPQLCPPVGNLREYTAHREK